MSREPRYAAECDSWQLVTVVLACPGGCPTVRVGDYLEVSGERVNEQQYLATDVSISR